MKPSCSSIVHTTKHCFTFYLTQYPSSLPLSLSLSQLFFLFFNCTTNYSTDAASNKKHSPSLSHYAHSQYLSSFSLIFYFHSSHSLLTHTFSLTHSSLLPSSLLPSSPLPSSASPAFPSGQDHRHPSRPARRHLPRPWKTSPRSLSMHPPRM